MDWATTSFSLSLSASLIGYPDRFARTATSVPSPSPRHPGLAPFDVPSKTVGCILLVRRRTTYGLLTRRGAGRGVCLRVVRYCITHAPHFGPFAAPLRSVARSSFGLLLMAALSTLKYWYRPPFAIIPSVRSASPSASVGCYVRAAHHAEGNSSCCCLHRLVAYLLPYHNLLRPIFE
jgi:hypothetical protein